MVMFDCAQAGDRGRPRPQRWQGAVVCTFANYSSCMTHQSLHLGGPPALNPRRCCPVHAYVLPWTACNVWTIVCAVRYGRWASWLMLRRTIAAPSKKMRRTNEASITSWRSAGVARRHHGLQCDADECGSRHRGAQGRPAGAELLLPLLIHLP